jgi:MFS family permease
LIERGGTPADVGWLAAIYTAPVVIGGLAAGVILDRYRSAAWSSPWTAQFAPRGRERPDCGGARRPDNHPDLLVAGVYGPLFMTRRPASRR